jgi:hypothetical protein
MKVLIRDRAPVSQLLLTLFYRFLPGFFALIASGLFQQMPGCREGRITAID